MRLDGVFQVTRLDFLGGLARIAFTGLEVLGVFFCG